MINLDSIKLENLNKPARYIGGEVNQVVKTDNVKSSIVLCYPNLYEKAMSSYIVNLLYNNINIMDDVWCKRCFAPDIDFEKLLIKSDYELFSLEDYRSIRVSDILLFVIDSELDFTNFFNMLNLAKIDIEKENRNKKSPQILILPINNINIKPIEKYADFVFSYESEKESIRRLLKYLKVTAQSSIVENIASMDEITSNFEDTKIIHMEKSIVPSIKINNSSIIIDFNYMDDVDEIITYIEKNIKARGINTVSFLNYDKVNEYRFCECVYKIKTNVDNVRILCKNIDFNKFEPNVIEVLLVCMEKTAVYFNVATCSKKIKNKTGIGTDRKKLLEKIEKAFKNNRNSIRLSFNIGLPEETYEDLDDIFLTLEDIVKMYSRNKARDKFSMKVILDYYIFTEKENVKNAIDNITKLETKVRYIAEKEYDNIIKIELKDMNSYVTRLLLKNGWEEFSDTIFNAYKLGARFNNDSKLYNKNAWEKAMYDDSKIINNYFNII